MFEHAADELAVWCEKKRRIGNDGTCPILFILSLLFTAKYPAALRYPGINGELPPGRFRGMAELSGSGILSDGQQNDQQLLMFL